jgi:hypothetical protein
VLDGGLQTWTNSGKPLTVAENGPWSMERQVRVTAGALVLTFFELGILTSKKFFLRAGLGGTGLVYSGVSDTCMMASVLGRMPWSDPKKAKRTEQVIPTLEVRLTRRHQTDENGVCRYQCFVLDAFQALLQGVGI